MQQKVQIAKELHKGVVNKFQKRRIITKGIDDIWAADLLIFLKYSKENRGFKYALVIIDTFSKYLFVEPLKTKTGVEVSKAFEKVIKTSQRKPNMLHVDKGREFVNKDFKNLLKKYNINMYHTENEQKSSIAERVNRTLNDKFRIYFEVNKDHKWTKCLPKILHEYNNIDVHRTIGMIPSKVNKENEKDILIRMYPLETKFIKPTFNIGDRVRITKKKSVFVNKYDHNWTTEIFTINKIHYTNPITYLIKDENGECIKGKFYKQELQKTKF